ncbi:metal ABC transporter permease [Tautonia plasticadhaerens]|uniref:Manganese transport system membrane protein MntB n=1 Tax=Tautonia plasticadhaerens TaxID=2527974 RepID=A0A518GVJ9_9BACT|nr:metal ABC transporter permease [Tautonia plasticadhaerens]QDV32625.1 Manganese transport system membrane protein MntB [Tautonia plasticadhaerens]
MGLTYNTIVVLLGTGLLGANAGLVGSFAVLRGRSLTGDALAHAALPGLCLAFLLVGERSLPAMLAGALASGVLGVAVISGLRRGTRVKEDAAIGIVLSVFFGLGIVLSRMVQNTAGVGNKAGLDSYILGKTAGIIRQDVLLIGGVSLVSLAAIVLAYKEFKLTVFDPGFARVQGWPVVWLDLVLMGLIALAVVFGLPMVGVVLMAALLILPGAAARFWTDRLGPMLALASAFGLVTGLVGTAISARYAGMPAGPIIVLVGSAVFLLSVLLAPRRGVLGRALAAWRFRRELQERKLLRLLYEFSEASLPTVLPFDRFDEPDGRGSGPGRFDGAVARLLGRGEIRLTPGPGETLLLTEAGLRRARSVVRGYRLWEQFLQDHPEQASAMADLSRESVDDVLPPDVVAELGRALRDAGQLPDPGPEEGPR